jgi:hypothetical protein
MTRNSVIALMYVVQKFRYEFGFYQGHSRIVALRSTQPLTEIGTRNFTGGKKRPARRSDILAADYELNVNLSQP